MPNNSNDPFAEFAQFEVTEEPLEEKEAAVADPEPEADQFAEFAEFEVKDDPKAPETKRLPVKQEQGVSMLERSAVHMLREGMFLGDSQNQIEYLQSQGYVAEREGDIIKVRRPADKEWRVVDPKGLTSVGDAVQDLWEAVPDIAMMAVAPAAAKGAGMAVKGAGKAIGTGAKTVGKTGLSIADRVFSLSPTYRKGKEIVRGAAKAHKQLGQLAKKIGDAPAKPAGGSREQALKDLEAFFRPKK